MDWFYGIIVYIIMVNLTWPALLAKFQEIYLHKETADAAFRMDLAMAIMFSLFPPICCLAPFLTGFYEHGFQFGRRKF